MRFVWIDHHCMHRQTNLYVCRISGQWRAATVRTRALEYPELVMSMSNLLFVDLSTLALAAATGKTVRIFIITRNEIKISATSYANARVRASTVRTPHTHTHARIHINWVRNHDL